jgi:hypothetical protein
MAGKLSTIISLSFSLIFYCSFGCTDTGRFAVSGKVGTLGPGGDLTVPITSNINARVAYNKLDLDYEDQEIENITYDVSVGLSSFSAMADWHIFDDPFRISGGVISIDNKFRLNCRLSEDETIDLGDNTYDYEQLGTLKGRLEMDHIAPYVGIGWGNPFSSDSRLGYTCDFGVAFMNAPNVSLSANGTASSQPGFMADLEKERKDLEDDLDVLKIYPVISVGLYFRF